MEKDYLEIDYLEKDYLEIDYPEKDYLEIDYLKIHLLGLEEFYSPFDFLQISNNVFAVCIVQTNCFVLYYYDNSLNE